jgi:hypothetical protein
MIVHRIAAPVRERFEGRSLTIAGGGRDAVYAELDGFVVAFTAYGVPLMPNGIALTGGVPAAGTRVTVTGRETWDPTLRLGDDARRRGAEILEVLGALPSEMIVRAVYDPAVAVELIGLGPGLTPEGDDLATAAAAVVAAGPWPAAAKAAWLGQLLPPDLRSRTTALSATLLELATAAQVIEPLQALFGPDWRPALARLVRLGHTTGRAYARAAASAAVIIGR